MGVLSLCCYAWAFWAFSCCKDGATLHCNVLASHCFWSHKGSPRIPEWVTHVFSSRSSQPRNRTWVLLLSWYRICLQCGRPGFDPWVQKIPWRRERLPTPVFWLRKFHGLYSPRGHKESDMTDRLSLRLGASIHTNAKTSRDLSPQVTASTRLFLALLALLLSY